MIPRRNFEIVAAAPEPERRCATGPNSPRLKNPALADATPRLAVGRVTPCAPFGRFAASGGAHGVTRPTLRLMGKAGVQSMGDSPREPLPRSAVMIPRRNFEIVAARMFVRWTNEGHPALMARQNFTVNHNPECASAVRTGLKPSRPAPSSLLKRFRFFAPREMAPPISPDSFPWPVKSLARGVFPLLHWATPPGSFFLSALPDPISAFQISAFPLTLPK